VRPLLKKQTKTKMMKGFILAKELKVYQTRPVREECIFRYMKVKLRISRHREDSERIFQRE
jgi:hypothetical protein